MKKMPQCLATIGLGIAAVVLLVTPVHGQAFVPTRFTVVDAGTAGKPDIVLIPGLASSRSVWDAESKLLAPRYRLHLVQIGGFAGTPAGPNAAPGMLPSIVEELHSYIAAGKMQPVVIGHSMGGLLALMLADKYPADVRKLVIVDTLPFYGALFLPGATVEGLRPMVAAMKAHMTTLSADQYAAGEKTMLDGMSNTEAGRKAAYDSAIASDHAVVGEALYEDALTDLRGDVGTIKTPTLVLYEYDATTKMPPADAYENLVKDGYHPMPNVTLVRIEGSRHFIMYDQPAKFDAAIEGWLE